MTRPTNQRLLEELYQKYNHPSYLISDPLGVIDRNLSPHDFEIVSLIASGLAYGRFEQIRKSILELLERLTFLGLSPSGDGIHQYLVHGMDPNEIAICTQDWSHRLNTHEDIIELFAALSGALKKHGSLASFFVNFFCKNRLEQHRFENSLVMFTGEVLKHSTHDNSKSGNGKYLGTGASWFFNSPANGSACKRILLWLKWMCRKDEVDPGTWLAEDLYERVEDYQTALQLKKHLLQPVDTHIFQWAHVNKITERKNINWKVVPEITSYFQKILPDDPLKYDFALTREGMFEFRNRAN